MDSAGLGYRRLWRYYCRQILENLSKNILFQLILPATDSEVLPQRKEAEEQLRRICRLSRGAALSASLSFLSLSLQRRHLAKEVLINFTWDTGCELGSPAPSASCFSQLYGLKLLKMMILYFYSVEFSSAHIFNLYRGGL